MRDMQNLHDATTSTCIREHLNLLPMHATREIGGIETGGMTGNGRGIEVAGGIFGVVWAVGGMIGGETVIMIVSVIVKGSRNVIGIEIESREARTTDLESGLGKETMGYRTELGILVRATTAHRTLQVGDQVSIPHVKVCITSSEFVSQNPTTAIKVLPLPLAPVLVHLLRTLDAKPPGPLLHAHQCASRASEA